MEPKIPPSEGYDTAPPVTFSVIVEEPTSTSTTSEHTTSHSSTKQNTSTAKSHKPSTSTCTSTSPAATNTDVFTFVQLHGSHNPYKLSEGHFLHTNFSEICPSQNCFTDCNNLTQVFTANSSVLSNSTVMKAEDVPVTLFGVCSNLANATALVRDNGDAGLKSYFKSPSSDTDYDIGLILSNLTMCLADTCDNTRNPSECNEYCRPNYLLESQDTLAISPNLSQCAQQLCESTCGLPYADQDVFGIGVIFIIFQ